MTADDDLVSGVAFILAVLFFVAMAIFGPIPGCEIKCPSNDLEMQSHMKYTIIVGTYYSASGAGVGTGGVGFGAGKVKPSEIYYTSDYHITPQGGIEFNAYNWREGTSTRVLISGGYTVRETDFAHFNYIEE